MTAATVSQSVLSHEELDDLGDFLELRCLPNGGMEISMLDGFLTAIVSAPDLAPANEWLPLVFGSTATAAEIEGARDQILRRMDEIVRMLEAERLSPIFVSGPSSAEDDERSGAPYVEYADLWCIGYTYGIALREQAWRPLTEGRKEEDRFILTPIFALAGTMLEAAGSREAAQLNAALDAVLGDGERREIVSLVPVAAEQIYHYWKAHRGDPRTPIRRAPQPGRNETCPCASGKKYKKCCGA
jgi:uncharacterized protein